MPHVVVVDEEPGIHDLFLGQAGRALRGTWARTRPDGRRILRREAVGLIVLESRLPDGGGLELLVDSRLMDPRPVS